MYSLIKYKIRYYKNALLKKQFFYLFILFSSLFVISFLWINKSSDSNLIINSDEVNYLFSFNIYMHNIIITSTWIKLY